MQSCVGEQSGGNTFGQRDWERLLGENGTQAGSQRNTELDGLKGKAMQVEEKNLSRSRDVGEHRACWRLSGIGNMYRKAVYSM
jgi:hypothetical protein